MGRGRRGRGEGGIVVTDIYISTLVNRVVTLLERDARIRQHQPRENLLTSPPFPPHYYLSTFGPGPRRAPGIGNERSIVPVGALSDGKRGEVRGRGWRRTRNEKESE